VARLSNSGSNLPIASVLTVVPAVAQTNPLTTRIRNAVVSRLIRQPVIHPTNEPVVATEVQSTPRVAIPVDEFGVPIQQPTLAQRVTRRVGDEITGVREIGSILYNSFMNSDE
jgi:hypothetical protein